MQLCDKINDLLSKLGQTPENFTGRILLMSMFNDISCDRNDNIDECLRNAESVKSFARRFGIWQWLFIGLDHFLKRSGTLPRTVHKEPGTTLRRKSCWNLQGVDILFSVQRLHCPGVLLKARSEENCLYTSPQIKTTIDTIYRIILSVNQPQCLRSSGNYMQRI